MSRGDDPADPPVGDAAQSGAAAEAAHSALARGARQSGSSGDPERIAPAGDLAPSAPGGRRKRHRRVVALSEVDRRRLAAGELSDPVEALHTGDAGPVRLSAEPQRGEGANDARLLRDVPPHWGPKRHD